PGEGTRYNEKYKNMDKILNQLELPNYNVNNFNKLDPYGQSGYFDVIDFDKKKYYKVYIRNGGGYANEVEFYGIIPLQNY
ncbi:hypothetical protein BU068_12725, partial [Staphylococcus succinus]|uniref:hypothetical protein n=1 Tax=Staphylococcus succinus TaxID=61015 RepID=UPI000FF2E71E